MFQPFTLLSMGLCFAILYLRYRSQAARNQPQSSNKQRLKTAKLLFGAVIAWLSISFTLKHMIGKIDGNDQEPTVIERIVSLFKE